MTLHRLTLIFALSLSAAGTACNNDPECAYERPVAVIELTTTDLLVGQPIGYNGLESFISCERGHSYTWTWVKVPDDSEVNDLQFSANGTPLAGEQISSLDVPGTYVLQLVVFDGVQNSVVALKVLEVSADNLPPEASAGEDQAARIGDKAIFDGSESYDPEDKLEEYRWRLEEAPARSDLTTSDIFAADTDTAEFVPDVDGTYVFSLQVKDDLVWSPKDYVSLVTPIDNEPPVSQASDPKSPDGDLTPCQSLDPIQLNGTRSYDPEGESLDYEWTLVSAPDGSRTTDASFSNRYGARPLFRADEHGAYSFELRVNDGVLWSAWDRTTVTTYDISENVLPVANAGADVVIEGRAKCRNVGGSWKCPECPAIDFELDASAGSVDGNGDALAYQWLQTAGPDKMTLSYPVGPITDARPAPLNAEYGKILTRTWTMEVRASDCEGESTSTVKLTYSCEGDE